MGHPASDIILLSQTHRQLTELWSLIRRGITPANIAHLDHLVHLLSMDEGNYTDGSNYGNYGQHWGGEYVEDYQNAYQAGTHQSQPHPYRVAEPPSNYGAGYIQQGPPAQVYGYNGAGNLGSNVPDLHQQGYQPQGYAPGHQLQGYAPGHQPQGYPQVWLPPSYPPHPNVHGHRNVNPPHPAFDPYKRPQLEQPRQALSPEAAALLNIAGVPANIRAHVHTNEHQSAAPDQVAAHAPPPADDFPPAMAGPNNPLELPAGADPGDPPNLYDPKELAELDEPVATDDIPTLQELRDWAKQVSKNSRFISATERDKLLAHNRDSRSWEMWEKVLIILFFCEASSPPSRLRSAMTKGTKTPTKTQRIPSVWAELSTDVFKGSRSPHLLCSQWWSILNTYHTICQFNKFTGGDGDGNAAEDETNVLKKLGRGLKQARRAGKVSESLQVWELEVWKEGDDSDTSIFTLIDNHLRDHPMISRTEEERPGVLSPKGKSTRDRYAKPTAAPKRRADELEDDDDLIEGGDDIAERVSVTGSVRSKSTRRSASRGRGSTTRRSIHTPGFTHTGSTQSTSIRTSNQSSLVKIDEDTGETTTFLPASALSEALRHTMSLTATQAANDKTRLELQQKYQESQMGTQASRSRMFDTFADHAQHDRHHRDRKSLVETLERMADIDRKANAQKFDQNLALLSCATASDALRTEAEAELRKLRNEDLSVAGLLRSLKYSDEKIQAIFEFAGLTSVQGDVDPNRRSPPAAGPSRQRGSAVAR